MIICASITYKIGGISPAVNDIEKLFAKSKYISVSFRDRTPVVDICIKFTHIFWLQDVISDIFKGIGGKKTQFCDLLVKGLCDYIVNGHYESKSQYIIWNNKFDIKFTSEKNKDERIGSIPDTYITIFKEQDIKYHSMIIKRTEKVLYSAAIIELDGERKLFMRSDVYNDDRSCKTTYYHDGDEIYDMLKQYINEILLIRHCTIGSVYNFFFKNKKNEEFRVCATDIYTGILEDFKENGK